MSEKKQEKKLTKAEEADIKKTEWREAQRRAIENRQASAYGLKREEAARIARNMRVFLIECKKNRQMRRDIAAPEILRDVIAKYIEAATDNALLPTANGLCMFAGMDKAMYKGLRVAELTAPILEEFETWCEEWSVQEGHGQDKDSKFAMFLLKSKHDYQDGKQNISVQVSASVPPKLPGITEILATLPPQNGKQ